MIPEADRRHHSDVNGTFRIPRCPPNVIVCEAVSDLDQTAHRTMVHRNQGLAAIHGSPVHKISMVSSWEPLAGLTYTNPSVIHEFHELQHFGTLNAFYLRHGPHLNSSYSHRCFSQRGTLLGRPDI
jgi:hypothetical protein